MTRKKKNKTNTTQTHSCNIHILLSISVTVKTSLKTTGLFGLPKPRQFEHVPTLKSGSKPQLPECMELQYIPDTG